MINQNESVLPGQRIFVAEDRSMLAMELCDVLEDQGCTIVGPAARVDRALDLVDEAIDVALLDIDLKGEASYEVARRLRRRGVPVVLLTGFDDASIPEDLRDLQVFEKPIEANRLVATLQRVLAPQ